MGPYLTRADFGEELYDAIQTQAALVTAIENVERLRFYGKKREAERMQSEVRRLEATMNQLLDAGKIAPADMRRLLAIAGARREAV